MVFPCAFLHVVGIQHSGPLCRGWAWAGGGWGWAWGLGLAKPQEERQEPGGKNSGGGAQQGELCPEGGPGSWGSRGGHGDHSRSGGGGWGGGKGHTSPQLQEHKQSNLWLVFLFLFLNGAFIKHQLGPVLSKSHEFLISLNSHRNSPLPSPTPILQITKLGPREVKSHVPMSQSWLVAEQGFKPRPSPHVEQKPLTICILVSH